MKSLFDVGSQVTRLRRRGAPPAPKPRPRIAPDIHTETLAVIFRQLRTMSGAGIPLYRGIWLLAQQQIIENKETVLRDVADEMRRGHPMSQAMAMYPGTFDKVYVAMVRIGELTGSIDAVLEHLAVLAERSMNQRRRVRAASVYPLFVLLSSLALIVGAFSYILPGIIEMLSDLHVPLPMATRCIIVVAAFFRSPWLPISLIIAGIAFPYVVALNRRVPLLPLLLEHRFVRYTLAGELHHKICLARGMRMLAGMLEVGLDIFEALPLTGETCNSAELRRCFTKVRDEITEGRTLRQAMVRQGGTLFPPYVLACVEVGEVTGKVPYMLSKASQIMEMEIANTLEMLPGLLEPAVILMLGIVVGVILIAVFQPLYAALQTL